MRATTTTALLLGAVLAAAAAGCGNGEPPPRAFFGIDPQGPTSDADAAYMRAGGIGSVRWTLEWPAVQPEAGGAYDWAGFDAEVAVAARHRLQVLPLLYGEPAWVGPPTAYPLATASARDAWKAFVRAAVERYGPGGSFWSEHGPGSAEPLPRLPVREWQIWNEANFSYFAEDVSPSDYAELVEASHAALREADPRARLILSGLFGAPKEGLDAAEFLAGIYETRGIANDFEGIALHPYARDSERLEELVDGFRAVADENGDSGVPLYLTEVGWGSQSGSVVSFEKGPAGQAEELNAAYGFLAGARQELGLRAVYWFSWRDRRGSCEFCDSVGLFPEGEGFQAKPAWEAFVEETGGRLRPAG